MIVTVYHKEYLEAFDILWETVHSDKPKAEKKEICKATVTKYKDYLTTAPYSLYTFFMKWADKNEENENKPKTRTGIL